MIISYLYNSIDLESNKLIYTPNLPRQTKDSRVTVVFKGF